MNSGTQLPPSFPCHLAATRGRPKSTLKRDAIVNAATQLFLNEGYELTSMDAIAKKADVSKLTIYSHFADKKELFAAIMRTRCDRFTTTLSSEALMEQPVEKALLSFGEYFTTAVLSPDSIRLLRIMQTEARRHPEVAQLFYETGPKRTRAAFAELLQYWHRKKLLIIPDTAQATKQFFSLLRGELILQILLGITPEPDIKQIRKHVRACVAMFLATYQPARP